MVVYRYRFVAFDDNDLAVQVPGAVTFQDIGSVFVDIDAPISSKDDLDTFMQTQGFEFYETSPVNSPSVEASEADGFVIGPGISVNDAVAVFTGTDGYTIGSSTVTIDSLGNMIIPGDTTISGNLNTNVSGDLSGSLPNPTVVDLSISGEQQGSILYFNGINWIHLPPAPNSDEYILRSAGPAANPFWQQKIYGTQLNGGLNVTFASTTGSAFVPYVTFTTGTIPPGVYKISYSYIWSYDSIFSNFLARLVVDSVTIIDHVQEPSDSGGFGPGGTDQRFLEAGFIFVTFGTPATHTINLDFASQGGATAAMYQGFIEMIRIL